MTPAIERREPSPVPAFNKAVRRIETIQSRETEVYNPILRTTLFSHGRKTKRAILWFHGYTSGVEQFAPLGRLCFDKGMNVLIPCLPHHGFRDRMTDEVSKIDRRELIQFASDLVEITRGLGEQVLVGGLSMGGVMASWVAQFQADIHGVMIIAPFLGAHIIPTPLTNLVAFGAGILPDQKVWWDAEKKENLDGVQFGYPRYSTHSLGQILRLGKAVFDAAHRHPPHAQKIWMVINDHDRSVNNCLCEKLADAWRTSKPDAVRVQHFPEELGLPHDCISEGQPGGNTVVVYSKIMDLIRD